MLLEDRTITSWSNILPKKVSLCDFSQQNFQSIRQLDKFFIPRGAGRSFGDASFVEQGIALLSKTNNKILDFNKTEGTISCEAGVAMGELHSYLNSSEWYFPIYGGTQYATVGGAVASDIHGKNDYTSGSFGNYVKQLKLVTANGEIIECSKDTNADLLSATIGGMGLTGFVVSVTIKLTRRTSRTIACHVKPVHDIEAMLKFFNEHSGDFQFCSWLTISTKLSNGAYYTACFTEEKSEIRHRVSNLYLPKLDLFNPLSTLIASFYNSATSNRQASRLMHAQDFNYIGPYETYKNWNNLYGKRGMIEYQFIVEEAKTIDLFLKLVDMCRQNRTRLYNIVIKKHSNVQRIGLLSFPKEGYSINFQVKNFPTNISLLVRFTDLLIAYNGRIYLTKDACILPVQLEAMYPTLNTWQSITRLYDAGNRIQSGLSQRLNMKPW